MTACAPHHRTSVVRRKDRPADLVGPHDEKLPALDHADNLPRRPDVVADERGGPFGPSSGEKHPERVERFVRHSLSLSQVDDLRRLTSVN